MPLVPCPQCHKGVQVLISGKVHCKDCGHGFIARVPDSPDSKPREQWDSDDYLRMGLIAGGTGLLLATACCGFGIWMVLPAEAFSPPVEQRDEMPHFQLTEEERAKIEAVINDFENR